MMQTLTRIFCLIIAGCTINSDCIASSNKIIAVVNKSAITLHEVMQAKKLVTLFNGQESAEPETLNSYSLSSLITQKLMSDQSRFLSLKPNEQDIINAIKTLEKRAKLEPGYLKKTTQAKGIYDFLQNKVAFDILIDNITKQALMPNITVSNDEIEDLAIISGSADARVNMQVFTSKSLDHNSYKQIFSLRNKIKKGHLPKTSQKYIKQNKLKSKISDLPDYMQPIAKGLKNNETSTIFKTVEGFKFLVMETRELDNFSEEDKLSMMNSVANNKLNIAMKKLDNSIQKNAYIKIFD